MACVGTIYVHEFVRMKQSKHKKTCRYGRKSEDLLNGTWETEVR